MIFWQNQPHQQLSSLWLVQTCQFFTFHKVDENLIYKTPAEHELLLLLILTAFNTLKIMSELVMKNSHIDKPVNSYIAQGYMLKLRFQNMSDSDGLIDLWRNAEFLICLKKTIPNVKSMTEFKGVRVMVFIATFNNISVISWQSVLLVEKTTDKHYHIKVSSTPCHECDSNSQLGDCIGSCKSNYHDVPQVAIYNNDTWSGGYL